MSLCPLSALRQPRQGRLGFLGLTSTCGVWHGADAASPPTAGCPSLPRLRPSGLRSPLDPALSPSLLDPVFLDWSVVGSALIPSCQGSLGGAVQSMPVALGAGPLRAPARVVNMCARTSAHVPLCAHVGARVYTCACILVCRGVSVFTWVCLCQAWYRVCGLRAHSLGAGTASRAAVCLGLQSGALAEVGSAAWKGAWPGSRSLWGSCGQRGCCRPRTRVLMRGPR